MFSLVGAAPTPYYRIGESLLKHDYDKALKNPIHDKTVPIRDTYRREQAYKSAKHSEVKFQVNDVVTHPKFGEGTVEEIVQLSNSVRLHIRFADDEVKKSTRNGCYGLVINSYIFTKPNKLII